MTFLKEFETYTALMMGDERYGLFKEAMAEPAPTSIRINPMKCPSLGSGFQPTEDAEAVAWCPLGRYLNSRPAFTFDPLMHAGAYYVQEASSMFLAEVMRQCVEGPVLMIDMCAAPGGKSSLSRSILPEGSILIANEPIRNRANILSENIQKLGHEDVIVTNNYPQAYAKSGLMADVILCDVPCSGEGMFRKDEGTISEWSEQNVEKCWRLQREIVGDAWQCLREGGIMVYSTCTFNTKENEENIRWICDELGAEVVKIEVPDEWNITGSLLKGFEEPVYRFIPGFTKGEGLFMAVLRKEGHGEVRNAKREKADNHRRCEIGLLKNALDDASTFDYMDIGDHIIALPKRLAETYAQTSKTLHVIHAGVTLGTRKGKDIIPDESLALSRKLNMRAFPTAELTYQQAIAFLRKENLLLSDIKERGFVLVTFDGLPLGFVKNLGNRANNLYPAEWKIRSSYAPESYERIINK